MSAPLKSSDAFALSDHAARAGADAISSIPPFAGGYVWDEIHAFYAQLARNSSLPVVAYHFPGLTGQQTSLSQLASLLAIPNIAGLKFTDPNFYVMQRLLARLSPEQVLYNGQDEALALGLSIGAHGGIGSTYNFMPELIVSIYRYARAGRHVDAIAAQREANAIIEAVLTCQIVAATKQILYWQGLIDCPACAFPRAPLSEPQQRKLRDLLRRHCDQRYARARGRRFLREGEAPAEPVPYSRIAARREPRPPNVFPIPLLRHSG